MADCKKYNGSTWEHSLRKLGTDTDTITTLPADVYADGNNATVGVKGNMSQSGTPTSDNPIQPQECGERTGNLFASVWEQGSINGTTGQNEVAGTLVRTKDYIPIKPNTAYSFERDIANGYMNVRLYRADKSYIGAGTTSTLRLISGTSPGNPMGNNLSLCCFKVIDSEAAYIRFNDSSNNTATKWLMVEGEYTWQTMPDYEPYGIKIPISSASTTTNVYLGEVQTTRKIKKLVLTGEETISGDIGYNRFFFTIQDMRSEGVRLTKLYCTHYQNISDGRPIANIPNNSIYTGGGADSQKVFIKTTDYTTVSGFKSYLAAQYTAGTPVCVWYVLANETTGIVNEPLRKIGDYADTVSGITVPTITGKDTFDVNTTLKPSSVSLNYTGWHDTQCKEYDGSQWV